MGKCCVVYAQHFFCLGFRPPSTGGTEANDFMLCVLRFIPRSTIRVLPSTGAFSAEKLSLLTSFAADPAPFQSPDKNYASQLDTVVGILKEMYANFAADLETLWTTEGQRQRGHELLVASKQTTINEYLATVAEKSATTANLNEILAQAESSYQETKEYIDVSTHEFDAGKDLCQRKHSEFTERNSLYDNEKEAVAKAIAILSTDAARGTFETAITAGAETRDVSFLQTSAGAQEPSARAVQVLKIRSRNSKSLRLASIAALIQQTPTGHFDAVMKSIDEMVQVRFAVPASLRHIGRLLNRRCRSEVLSLKCITQTQNFCCGHMLGPPFSAEFRISLTFCGWHCHSLLVSVWNLPVVKQFLRILDLKVERFIWTMLIGRIR